MVYPKAKKNDKERIRSMKNTWKEFLYDFCTRVFKSRKNVCLLVVLWIVTFVIFCFTMNLVLVECATLFWWFFMGVGRCVAKYNKATFFANKTITLLLADELVCCLIMLLVLKSFWPYVTKQYVDNYLDEFVINVVGIPLAAIVSSTSISAYFEEKVVRIEKNDS